MPKCPQCQAPVEEDQRFCKECGAGLQAEAKAPSPVIQRETRPAAPPAPRLPIPAWLLGLVAVLGVVIVVLAVLLLSRPGAPPSPAPAPPGPPAAAPGASLEGQLTAALNTLRGAQLKQDLTLFLACFAPDFPGLDQKRQQVKKQWQQFTFVNMFYFLEDITPKGPDHAIATVSWDIRAQDRHTKEYVNGSQTYRVGFIKSKDRWLIAFLEDIPSK